ncbi:MAG: hypothetical protein K0S98_556, partial [Propionibacteriaceae bacterium]|nr:hypothetical protein [Propionibacteriaceae bacterium]
MRSARTAGSPQLDIQTWEYLTSSTDIDAWTDIPRSIT